MSNFFNNSLIVTLFALFLFAPIFAQKKEKVESSLQYASPEELKQCQYKTVIGKVISMPKPKYATEAKAQKIGGTVEVVVRIDEKGNVSEVEKVSGHKLLQGAAVEAALKAKFTPSLCDSRPISVSGILVYHFIPASPNERYFLPEKLEDFTDLQKDSPYYEAILDLTENYKVAFGYGDRKFYGELPLTRGDFAHFLRLTLDLLQRRAEIAKINPRQIGLFNAYNPKELNSFQKIKDFNEKSPYSESVKFLLQTYDIGLFNEQNEFNGEVVLKFGELKMIWNVIFGDEAVPINFTQNENTDKVITRGEFALFLQESLRILTYKILP